MEENQQLNETPLTDSDAAAVSSAPAEPTTAESASPAPRKRGFGWLAGRILLYTMIPVASLVLAIVHSTKAQKDDQIRTLARACLIVDGVIALYLALDYFLIRLVMVMTLYYVTTSIFGG